MDDTSFLTVDETSQRLRVSPDTIRRLLRDKKLRGVRVGGQWRVPTDAFEEVISPRLGDLMDEAIETLIDQKVGEVTIPAGTVGYVVSESRGRGGIYDDTITFRQTLERDSSSFPDLILNRAELGTTWKFVPDDGGSRLVPKPLLRELKTLLNRAYSATAEADCQMALENGYVIVRIALGPNERTDEEDAIPKAIKARLSR